MILLGRMYDPIETFQYDHTFWERGVISLERIGKGMGFSASCTAYVMSKTGHIAVCIPNGESGSRPATLTWQANGDIKTNGPKQPFGSILSTPEVVY
jgi:hypothetical protein